MNELFGDNIHQKRIDCLSGGLRYMDMCIDFVMLKCDADVSMIEHFNRFNNDNSLTITSFSIKSMQAH